MAYLSASMSRLRFDMWSMCDANQADVFFDNRHKDGVMTWINGVTSMVVVRLPCSASQLRVWLTCYAWLGGAQAATGLREVHSRWKPPQSRTCYRGVVSFAARIEADAYVLLLS